MRIALLSGFFLSLAFLPMADAGKKSGDADEKEGLYALQDFIGGWKGSGGAEKASWSWRFKDKDRWMAFDLTNSKLYKSGEVRYLAGKSKYEVTIIDKAGKKAVFTGEMKKSVLIVERVNDANDTEQLKLSSPDGDRLVYELWVKPDGRNIFTRKSQVGYTREGVTFGVEAGGKKPECVVTGGLGTISVSYMGKTYYVCCSGCRDAFNDNPAKIVADYMKKKKK
jgi:hypothetical protein